MHNNQPTPLREMKEEENKDWNEFWGKYTSFKIDTEWLETNYPEVLKAWKEHRQPIILERVYQREQAKKRAAAFRRALAVEAAERRRPPHHRAVEADAAPPRAA